MADHARAALLIGVRDFCESCLNPPRLDRHLVLCQLVIYIEKKSTTTKTTFAQIVARRKISHSVELNLIKLASARCQVGGGRKRLFQYGIMNVDCSHLGAEILVLGSVSLERHRYVIQGRPPVNEILIRYEGSGMASGERESIRFVGN